MSSNIKPLVALGLTAMGAALVVNFKVAEPTTVVSGDDSPSDRRGTQC